MTQQKAEALSYLSNKSLDVLKTPTFPTQQNPLFSTQKYTKTTSFIPIDRVSGINGLSKFGNEWG